jgi:hypothetical protein
MFTARKMIVTMCVCALGLLASGAQAANVLATFSATAADSTHSGAPGGHALYSPGGNGSPAIPNGGDARFVFDGNGMLTIYDDGTANLTGTLVSVGDSQSQWAIDLWLENARDHTDFVNGGGMPKLELYSSNYVANGGAVDPTTWYFFDMDETRSTLTGVGSIANGEVLSLFQIPADGSKVFQIGFGANGKNLNLGFSEWLGYEGPNYNSTHSDLNIDLTFIPPPTQVIPTPAALPAGRPHPAQLRRPASPQRLKYTTRPCVADHNPRAKPRKAPVLPRGLFTAPGTLHCGP